MALLRNPPSKNAWYSGPSLTEGRAYRTATSRRRRTYLALCLIFTAFCCKIARNAVIPDLFRENYAAESIPAEKILSGICDQPSPPASQSKYSDAYGTPEYRLASAERLSKAIQIPTQSFDDMGPVDKDIRWKPFKAFLEHLKVTYPALHSKAELIVIGAHSPVYTLRGTVPNLKPVMLMAHSDVVPSLTALDRWTHPPFSGTIDDEWIYGRGAYDDKNQLIGIVAAVEHLLSSGWVPKRTLVLAFGQDEEIGTKYGAYSINVLLESIYGKNGFAVILDEGGMGIETKYGVDFALPGIAEKGSANFQITVDMLGGHSSIPSAHTSIGMLAKIVSAIEDSDVFQPHLEEKSPLWGYISCLAAHGAKSDVPSWIRDAVFSKNPDLQLAASHFANESLTNRYLVQTSKAVTIFHGGLKVNALPESAQATFNTRVEIFSSPAEVERSIFSIIRPIAQKYSLVLNGASLSSQPTTGNITVFITSQKGSSPISPVDSEGWYIFARAIQAAFGANVVTSPTAMTANTDTRHYVNLSRNIYRWNPIRVGTGLNLHTVDEKIKIDTHVASIRFYTEFILQADEVLDDSGF